MKLPLEDRRRVRPQPLTPAVAALWIGLFYALIGGLWILFSDRLVGAIATDARMLTELQTLKGWFYVALTAALLSLLVYHYGRHLFAQNQALQEHQEALARLNRGYRMLSAINGSIVRIRERDELAGEACRICVELGGFDFAWLAVPEADGRGFATVARAGDDRGWLGRAMRARMVNRPDSALTRLLRERRAFVATDLADETLCDTWCTWASSCGFRALAAFPVSAEDRLSAVMVLLSRDQSAFDDAELRLLDEMSNDVGLGLDVIGKAQRLDYLARHDPVTHLPNESYLRDRIDQAIAHRRPGDSVGLMVINVQGFRRINDLHGHGVADEVLRAVASTLGNRLRPGDTLARLGSHEFAVMAPELADLDQLYVLAREVMDVFPLKLAPGDETLEISASAGVASCPHDAKTADELVRAAMLTVNARRHASHDVVHFYSAEEERAYAERMLLEQALRDAVRDQGFELYYLPVVELQSGLLRGAEALLRWRSPALGDVSPGRFIPIAEESGLIGEIGLWTVEQAWRQAQAWRSEGLPELQIAVNVSARQLDSPAFVQQMRVLANQSRETAAGIALEITETSLLADPVRANELLSELREHGFRIYLDDFGTGYSTLEYLASLNIDALKIDRSFVSRLGEDDTYGLLVTTMLSMAKALGLIVIAEGVETRQQAELLREAGCELAQGFYFARPRSAQVLESLLREAAPAAPCIQPSA